MLFSLTWCIQMAGMKSKLFVFVMANFNTTTSHCALPFIILTICLLVGTKAKNLCFSPFGTLNTCPCRHEVEKTEKALRLFSDTMDEWLECQRQWLYLETIFRCAWRAAHMSFSPPSRLLFAHTYLQACHACLRLHEREYCLALC